MKTLALTTAALLGVLTLSVGCTSGHKEHGGSDERHADAETDSAHGHGADGEDHQASRSPDSPGPDRSENHRRLRGIQ